MHPLDRKLGYFRDNRFVLFYYEPRGQEVMWNDGQSYGFACGGWMTFMDQVAPQAERQGMNLGSDTMTARHALVIDRQQGRSWFADRSAAEALVSDQNRPLLHS
jgi:hypothetical protein